MEDKQNSHYQNSQPPVSGNQNAKPPVSPLEIIVVWLTIIANICQISDFSWKIYDYVNPSQPPSVEIIQQPKKNADLNNVQLS